MSGLSLDNFQEDWEDLERKEQRLLQEGKDKLKKLEDERKAQVGKEREQPEGPKVETLSARREDVQPVMTGYRGV